MGGTAKCRRAYRFRCVAYTPGYVTHKTKIAALAELRILITIGGGPRANALSDDSNLIAERALAYTSLLEMLTEHHEDRKKTV